MICIIEIENNDISGWIISTDIHDARRQAYGAGLHDMAAYLYTIEQATPGKYTLPTGHIMLVD